MDLKPPGANHEDNEEGYRGGGGVRGGRFSYTNNVPLGTLNIEPPRATTMASARPFHVYVLLDLSLAGFSVLEQHKVQTIERVFSLLFPSRSAGRSSYKDTKAAAAAAAWHGAPARLTDGQRM